MNQIEIKETAEYILMRAYENMNWTNCYGHCPRKSKSVDFQKALKKALKIAKSMHPGIYNYLLINYA